MSRIGCMWAGKILTRLHLCTVSPEPSLTTYAPYWVYVSREDWDETTLVHSLPWAFPDYLGSVLGVCEQGRFWLDCTCAQSPLRLPWSLMLRIGCLWAWKILTRLHLYTVSSEPSLVTYSSYCGYESREESYETTIVHSLLWAFPDHLCSVLGVCEQGRFWRDCTWAQSPLSTPLVTYASYNGYASRGDYEYWN